MRNKRLQNRVTTGRITLPVVIFTCLLCCGATNLLFFPLPAEEITYPLWKNIVNVLPGWSLPLIAFALFSMVGYSLIEFNNRFNIIGIRGSIQTSLYFLLATAIPWLFSLHAGSIVAFALLFSLFFLFKSYQQHQSSGDLFHSFVFMGLGSLLLPQLSFLAPLWWITAYRFQSLNPRSFFATLVGWNFPYWLLFGYAFYHQQMDVFYQPFVELVTFHPVNFLKEWHLHDLVTLGYLFLLFIVSTIHCFVAGYQDKIRTRQFLNVMIQLGFFLLLYCLLQPVQFENILPLFLITVSVLAAHFFGLSNSRASNIFFIVSMAMLILLFGFNVWVLL